MATVPAVGGPSLGLFEGSTVHRFLNGFGAAITAGSVYQILTTTIDSGTQMPTTVGAVSDVETGLFAVALEDIANSATASGMFQVRGKVTALMQGATTAGDALAPDAGEALDVAAINEKCIGYALVATAGATKTAVLFNGIEGFGTKVT